MSLSGDNCILNEQDDLDQDGSSKIPSKTIPCYSCPASLVDQHSIPIEFLCQGTVLAQSMFLTRMKISVKIAHMQNHPR